MCVMDVVLAGSTCCGFEVQWSDEILKKKIESLLQRITQSISAWVCSSDWAVRKNKLS